MKTRAAVARAAGEPLSIEEVDLEGPRAGEVLVEIKATGVCHTDAFTLSGDDPEGLFPSILGHEGAGVVLEVGEGVTTLAPGDHVIPLYMPECRQCKTCLSGKSNLCTAIRATQGQGLMPDSSSRFSKNGQAACSTTWAASTFSEPHGAARDRRREDPQGRTASRRSACIGCGVTTGIGAVKNTAQGRSPATTVVGLRSRRHRPRTCIQGAVHGRR